MKRIQERNDINAWLALLTPSAAKEGKSFREKLYKMVSKPRRARVSVNIYKLERMSKEGERVIIPGKVLSDGKLTHKVKIAALNYSAGAKKEITNSGSEMVTLESLLKEKAKGGIRIIV
jgi:large subunit ribosomal protein L18e